MVTPWRFVLLALAWVVTVCFASCAILAGFVNRAAWWALVPAALISLAGVVSFLDERPRVPKLRVEIDPADLDRALRALNASVCRRCGAPIERGVRKFTGGGSVRLCRLCYSLEEVGR